MSLLWFCCLVLHTVGLTLAQNTDVFMTYSVENNGRQAACPGEEVTFECSVTDARSLRWIAKPFISDDQIVFQLSNNTGSETVVTIMPFKAVLTQVEMMGNYGRLNSELLVTASESLEGTVVECLATGNISMGRTLTLAAPPSPPQQLRYSVSRYHLNDFNVTVQWESPANGGDNIYTVSTTVAPLAQLPGNILMTTLTLSYNEMHMVSITASNCAGESTASVVTIYEVGCGPPTPPPRGSLGDLTSSQEGTVVTFQCSPGLVPSQMTSVCAANGSWTPDPAGIVCRADCGDPSLSVNGVVMACGSTLEGSQIFFQCNPGFVASQESEMMSVCAANGSWTPDPAGLVCRADCGIPVIVNGSVNYTTTVEGSTATYQCDTGLVPEGVITAMCMDNGEWAPDPGCRLLGQVTDGAPPSPMDASICLSTAEAVGVTFVLSSIVSFTAGLLVALVIAYCYIRQQKSQSSPRDLQQPVPTYENISTTINKKIEMKENAAYGLIDH